MTLVKSQVGGGFLVLSLGLAFSICFRGLASRGTESAGPAGSAGALARGSQGNRPQGHAHHDRQVGAQVQSSGWIAANHRLHIDEPPGEEWNQSLVRIR